MNDRSVFHLISDITHEEGISCVLIGGFAINHYKVTRQTADVDFLITKEDFDKIAGLLEKAGYKNTSLQENFVQLESSRLSLLNVDFMFVDQETLKKIMKEGNRFKIVGQTFTVPSLYHLIALKLHSIKHNPKLRLTKDMPDIINLIRINEINIKDKKFREICLKYGTADLYDKISEALK
jgi:Uncharacterised nucleotidyltransferase